MPRRSLVHVLLSLLLLLSQQMAISHGFSHWTGAPETVARTGPDAGGKAPKTPLADHLCSQCVAAAQVVLAIGSRASVFAATDFSFAPIASPVTVAACLLTVFVFQPRAPPQA